MRSEITYGEVSSNSGGRWATERLYNQAMRTGTISTDVLRSADTLPYNVWIDIDRTVLNEYLLRAPTVGRLIAAGLSRNIPNALGKTVYGYQVLNDSTVKATMSLSGLATGDKDKPGYSTKFGALPITSFPFNFTIRELAASRDGSGETLEDVGMRIAAQRVAECSEEVLYLGGPTFNAMPMYGLTTHPSRITASFTAGTWTGGAVTSANRLKDIVDGVAAMDNNRMHGPYMVLMPNAFKVHLDADYAPSGLQSEGTLRERILKIGGLTEILISDFCPADTIIILQMDTSTIRIANGLAPQTVQWDMYGGMQLEFLVMAIQVPEIRGDGGGRLGIVHIS